MFRQPVCMVVIFRVKLSYITSVDGIIYTLVIDLIVQLHGDVIGRFVCNRYCKVVLYM